MIQDIDIAKKFLQLKQSAESRNLEFNLSLKTVRQLLTRKKCFYTYNDGIKRIKR